MPSEFDIFPSEGPVPRIDASADDKPKRLYCRCGRPVGLDRLDASGYRIATGRSIQCPCSKVQQLIDG